MNADYAAYLNSPEWRNVRELALCRDGYRCVVCGDYASDIHHITYEHIKNERQHLEDVVSLCRECHQEAEKLASRSLSSFPSRTHYKDFVIREAANYIASKGGLRRMFELRSGKSDSEDGEHLKSGWFRINPVERALCGKSFRYVHQDFDLFSHLSWKYYMGIAMQEKISRELQSSSMNQIANSCGVSLNAVAKVKYKKYAKPNIQYFYLKEITQYIADNRPIDLDEAKKYIFDEDYQALSILKKHLSEKNHFEWSIDE